MNELTPKTLKAFEARVAAAYDAAQIRAPVHLSGGNETQLIDYFRELVKNGDWVFSTWRSHYHALLAGVPEEELYQRIIDGHSITLCFPEYKFFTSAIVAGHIPIAVGVAMALKKDEDNDNRVHCFLGDMTKFTGVYNECARYAFCHNLPITFIEENNGVSVLTKIDDVWPKPQPGFNGPWSHAYDYHLEWPHAGAGKRIEF